MSHPLLVKTAERLNLVVTCVSEKLHGATRAAVKRSQCVERALLNLFSMRIDIFTYSGIDNVLLGTLKEMGSVGNETVSLNVNFDGCGGSHN